MGRADTLPARQGSRPKDASSRRGRRENVPKALPPCPHWDSTVHIPPPQSKAIYQIVQEALENSIAHSECSLVELLLKSTRNGPVAEIRDNGKGFDAADLKSQKGLGLLVMEHCAREAGLKLTVQSESPGGTTVVIAYENPAPEQ